MNVLLLTHYFEPENGAPQRRWSALIERFSAAGVSVRVVAPPPHYPDGRVRPEFRSIRPGTVSRSDGGAYVDRVAYVGHRGDVVTRSIDHMVAAVASYVRVSRGMRAGLEVDVIVATAPALESLVAGRMLAKRFNLPFIAEMRDAWPDLVSHTPGMTHERGLVAEAKRRVHGFVTGLQRDAALVVTTTDSFAKVLGQRGVQRVEVIRNGTDLDRYARIAATIHDHGALRVLYMGTVGRSQGLDTLIRAASILRREGVDVHVRIVGSGADVRRLRALNLDLGSPVELFDRVASHEVMRHYEWADTTVVSLRDWQPFRWTVPSKVYELMATGKHITASVAGEAADLVVESNSGDVVGPGDAEALAELWRRIANDRQQLDARNGGRAWVASNADFDLVAARYINVLERALRR